MKLVFIYGAPATGKLTVAKELSLLTGFNLFHNHLTVDLGMSLFERGTEPYIKLVDTIRLDSIEAAARENISLIFTFVYGEEDQYFVNAVKERVEKYNGQVHFVRLFAETEELEKRVQEESRKEFRKIKSVELLHSVLEKIDFTKEIPAALHLNIDTTHSSPSDSANKIKDYFNL